MKHVIDVEWTLDSHIKISGVITWLAEADMYHKLEQVVMFVSNDDLANGKKATEIYRGTFIKDDDEFLQLVSRGRWSTELEAVARTWRYNEITCDDGFISQQFHIEDDTVAVAVKLMTS